MYRRHSLPILFLAVVSVLAVSPDASAQRRGGGGGAVARPGGAGRVVGRAVPRQGPPPRSVGGRYSAPNRYYSQRYISPRVVGIVPYRPYYYGYRPGLTVGFYSGYGYRYPYGYPFSYGYYPYGSYYYPHNYYGGYSYPLPPAGYLSAVPGYAYGGVRIEGAPQEAQVFADGYYMGIVDDFDGIFQHLNLQAGAHQIEIRAAGLPPIAFDVNVQPGRTITYHAGIR